MDWEFYILNFIQKKCRTPFLDFLMPLISLLGAFGALWIVITVVSLFISKYRRFGISMAFNLCVSLIVCHCLLKYVVCRIRPYDLNQTVSLLVKPEFDPSFPSGHTFYAFSAATVIFMYNKKLGLAMYALSFAIALSRLYLYIHFPTDVMFGVVFGIITGFVACTADRMIFSKDSHLIPVKTENE